MLMKVEAGFEHYSKNPYIYTRSMNPKMQNAMNRVCITLIALLPCHPAKMNKTERVEMPEDSVDTVGLDRAVAGKISER